jgi:hypothetical protein
VSKMNNKKLGGSAIVLTVLGIAAMTTLTFGVAQLVPDDFRQSQALESSISAENAAWAGVEHALYIIKNAQANNQFFELSKEYKDSGGDPATRPYGTYTLGSTDPNNCYAVGLGQRDKCPGIDRQLGVPVNQTPVDEKVFGSPDTYYQLVVWHRKHNVGNVYDLNDNYPSNPPNNIVSLIPESEILPTLDRDEQRQLDVRDNSTISLKWKPVFNSYCRLNADPNSRPKFRLLYYFVDDNNDRIPDQPIFQEGIGLNTFNTNSPESQIDLVVPPGATKLDIQFLVTDERGGLSDEREISECYVRYSIANQPNESSDLGVDVIDSIGVSAGVRRKVRVLVSRQNGRALGIFDFGIACENCENIN